MSMTQHVLEDAFLADIVEHPDDDVPRLVFADWLEDNGDAPRAEFIRLQCQLARLPEKDPARMKLEQREAELLGKHQHRWMAALAYCGVSWPTFHRGFIEAVDCSASVFLSVADALFQRSPIRDVTLHEVGPHLRELSRCSALSRLSALRVAFEPGEALLGELPLRGFADLCYSHHLKGLRVLDVTGCNLGVAGAAVLALPAALPGLVELGLANNNLHDAGVAQVLAAPARMELEVLDLGYNSLTTIGVQWLAQIPKWRKLRWLRLEGNPIGDAGIEAILDAPALAGLSHLACGRDGLRADVRRRLQERFPG